MKKESLLVLLSGVFLVLVLAALPLMSARAQTAPKPAAWKPSGPITLIVHHGAGGGYDKWARGIARVLTKHVGVPVPVKNIPGGGGVTGTDALWRAKADGQTIGLINNQGLTVGQIFGKGSYDLLKFTVIGTAHVAPLCLWVAVDSPFRSLEELVKAGKAKPLRSGTTSFSSSLWQSSAVLAFLAGFDIVPVAGYKSGGEILVALEAGDFDMTNMSVSVFMPGLQRGVVRCLAVPSASRDPRIPNVPTYDELGYPKMTVFAVSPRTVVAPPDLPPTIAAFLEKAFMETMRDPEWLAWVKSLGDVAEPLNAKQAFEAMKKLFDTMDEFKPILEPYMKVKKG